MVPKYLFWRAFQSRSKPSLAAEPGGGFSLPSLVQEGPRGHILDGYRDIVIARIAMVAMR